MKLETKRLSLFPLTYEQLLLYKALNDRLETELGLQRYPRTIAPNLAVAIDNRILPGVKNNPGDWLFLTIWLITDSEKKLAVGDLCFKGAPGEKGEIEIGYGGFNGFQGRGYMTEAVAAISTWALAQPGVKTIFATTDPANTASQRVLAKNNFTRLDTAGDIEWRLSR
ncbi:MAG: GNAT family N-acetyltransferase [Chitinophagaceae bacterium]